MGVFHVFQIVGMALNRATHHIYSAILGTKTVGISFVIAIMFYVQSLWHCLTRIWSFSLLN